jgi:hypothetical protein
MHVDVISLPNKKHTAKLTFLQRVITTSRQDGSLSSLDLRVHVTVNPLMFAVTRDIP